MPTIKKIVYGYILDEILKNDTRSDLPEGFLPQDVPDLQQFLNSEIQPIKNRIPNLPCSKEAVSNDPLSVFSVMKHILLYYESIRPTQPEQPQPRLFSLFPNPSTKWRFIKIDRENIDVLFHEARIQKENNESQFSLTTRRFFHIFDFKKLKINR